MPTTYFKAIRSIAKLTISFAFELAEQQIMFAKQLTDKLVKPPSRPSKATFVAPNVPLGTKADDVSQVLAGKTIDDTVQARVTAPDDSAPALVVRTPDDVAPALVRTPDDVAPALVRTPDDVAPALVRTPDDVAPALVRTPDDVAPALVVRTPDDVAPALVRTPDDVAPALVRTPDDVAPALLRTPDDAVQPLVITPLAVSEMADDAIQARVINADDAAPVLITTTDEDHELSLRAERLVIDKQRAQHGEAQVRKEIMTEMKSIAVPVNHEELVVERHAVTGNVAIDSDPIADETIRIPLDEEKVNIAKETVVWDEVEIGKRHVEEVKHISDTVRHEELRIDGTTTDPVTPAVNPEKRVTTADDAAPTLVTMPRSNTTTAENEQAVFDAQVQKRAYALWQAEGRPDGQQVDHWRKAELELAAMRPNAGNDC